MKPFQVGDRVVCIHDGDIGVVVVKTTLTIKEYPVCIMYSNGDHYTYTSDGYQLIDNYPEPDIRHLTKLDIALK